MNIIETQGLTCRYGRHEAVQELDLAIPAGGVTALLGANGAGKSTTIKLLMNLIAPSAGRASVLGVDSRRLGPAEFRRIGYPWRVVAEDSDFGVSAHFTTKRTTGAVYRRHGDVALWVSHSARRAAQ